MSNTKRSLPEDFSALQGDEVEPQTIQTDATEVDYAMFDLRRDILTLRNHKSDLISYRFDLKELATQLTELADELEVPF